MTAELPGISTEPAPVNPFVPNTEGVWHNLPADLYHAAPGISQSGLKHFEQSPAHYKWRKEHPEPPTDAMKFGTLVHTAVLEPHLLNNLVVEPDKKRPTSAQVNAKKPSDETTTLIQFWKEWDEANKGKIVVSSEDRDRLLWIRDAVAVHPVASAALATDTREVSVFQRFFYGGQTLRKIRMDAVNGNAGVDIKTIDNALELDRQCLNLRYYRQGAYYIDTWNDAHPENKLEAFVFIAVEKDPPFGIIVYELDEEDIQRGRGEYIALLARFINCESTDKWPSYEPKIHKLSLPAWAKRRESDFGHIATT